ncbi:MAG: yhcZ [Pedosphaera sp.]|nr:yhcZ [Pedosphaera sp.]
MIIEAEEAVRKAIAFWIDRQPGFFCAGEFASISEALDSTHLDRADLLLASRKLMEQPGGAPLEWIRKHLPALNTFGFGIYEESNYIFHLVTGVKSGYFLCCRRPGRLFEPIQSLANQPRRPCALLEREIQRYFQSLFAGQTEEDAEDASTKLTPREHDVLPALTKGLSEKEVATMLRISTLTVHNHVKNIDTKFGAHSRTKALMKYLGR